MIVYVLILLSLMIYPLFKKRTLVYNAKTVTLNNKVYIFTIAFILIIVLGLRGISVGIDTITYYNSFNYVKFLSFNEIFDASKMEFGYILFEFLIGKVFYDFQILLLIVAVLFVGVISNLVYKYSRIPMFSFIFFIVFGFYTFAMSATRQTIAIALILIAFEFINEKKLYKFLFFTFLASCFHITALIFLPCYLFNLFKLNKKTIFILIITAISVIIQINEIRELFTNYARIATVDAETGGSMLYLFILLSVILGIIYRKPFIANSEYNKFFFFMMALSAIIMPITQFNPVVIRLIYYFFIFMIIYIPNLLVVIDNKLVRYIGICGYIVTGTIYFFSHVIYVSELEDYLFFWQ